MKYKFSVFLFFFSLTAIAVPVTGSLKADQACPAYLSKNKKTNPGNLTLQANQDYLIREVNNATNPTWLRIEMSSSSADYPLRWVNIKCGQANFVVENSTCQNSPGNADAYILALSWQPGFCKTYGYEAGKPECLQLSSESYSASHLVLHGLWPNQDACGQKYGFCGVAPKSDYCNYPALTFNTPVSTLLQLLMPSFAVGSCLERHEWYKHGSCQVLSNNDYFSLALRLTQEAQATSFGTYLSNHVGKQVPLSQVHDVIKQSFGEDALSKIYLGCKQGYLVDIFIKLPALIPFEQALTSLVQQSKAINRYDGCPKLIKISNFSNQT